MMADTMDALGLGGQYVVKVNNRKVFDGLRQLLAVGEERQWLTVMRAIDKLDRLGLEAVGALLGSGRRDESGDFTEGAQLAADQIERILNLTGWRERGPGASAAANGLTISSMRERNESSATLMSGCDELEAMNRLFETAGYAAAGEERIRIDPSVVRGLEYYTGPVFEIELTFPVLNEKGQQVVFGSVGGGGRYDGLVSRFRSEPVPATGFSMGVSRLVHALKLTGNLAPEEPVGPVVILVLDKEQTPRYQEIVSRLRNAGIRAEMFLGATRNMRKQLEYAYRRNAPAAIIECSQ
jgi:histidyl-tRNA synthetase